MSVSQEGAVSLYYYPSRDDPARASGIFTGLMTGTGDGGGGDHNLTLELDKAAIQNRIWMIRTIIVSSAAVTVFRLTFGDNYWNANTLRIADTLNNGQNAFSWEYEGAAIVHVPAQNLAGDTFMKATFANAAILRRFWVQGEFYDQATLRKYEVGPDIIF